MLLLSSPCSGPPWLPLPHCRCLPGSAVSHGFRTECSGRKGIEKGGGGGKRERGGPEICMSTSFPVIRIHAKACDSWSGGQ